MGVCWSKRHQVILSLMVGRLSTLPLDARFLGGVWVVSVEPVMAGPYRVTR